MYSLFPALRPITALCLLLIAGISFLFLPSRGVAQSFANAEGLLQGEHLARVTPLLDDTLAAGTHTSAWIPFGTHNDLLSSERPYAPTRFTAFVRFTDEGVVVPATPVLTLSAQVALDDTATVYVNRDNTLTLIPAGLALSYDDIGQAIPVPVYGGGWLRFIAVTDDSAHVQLDLWRAR